jgi:predicted MFS family arabinose efflux permease
MLIGALTLVIGLCIGPFVRSYSQLLPLWLILGLAYSLTQTPSGRLLRRSTHSEDRPAIFAAQFALSHACWLLTYPLAGWVGAAFGFSSTFALLAAVAAFGLLTARTLWPRNDPEALEHVHRSLDEGHPHIADAERSAHGFRHRHTYVIDSHHPEWPSPAR